MHGEAALSMQLAHGSWYSLFHTRGAHSGPFQSWARFPSQACWRGDLWAWGIQTSVLWFTHSPVLTFSGEELTENPVVTINAAFVLRPNSLARISAGRQEKQTWQCVASETTHTCKWVFNLSGKGCQLRVPSILLH